MAQDIGRFPGPTYAWYTVILLTIAYVFSYIDRYILSLLVEPIKADLGLSDTQFSLLLGPAFAIFYVSMGVPIGWLADRKRRTLIVGVGIAVWSAATAVSGLTRNFAQLFWARLTIGVGEATLAPCALSLISDSFPKAKRARAIAFYMTALSFGGGIAYLVSGRIIAWSIAAAQIDLPLVGSVKPWQFTFIAVGLPGLILAVLMFFLREPSRKERSIESGHASLRDTLRFIGTRRAGFTAITAMASVMIITAYSHQWSPALYSRTWDWDLIKFTFYHGLGLLTIGPPTVFFTGWLTDYLYAKGQQDAPITVMILGSCIMIPFGILFPLMPTGEAAFALYCFNLVGIAMITAAGPIAILSVTPGEIRGQISAVYYMVISFAGLLLGPTGVALFTDIVFGDESMIQYSISAVAALFGVPLLVALPFIRKWFTQETLRLADGRADSAALQPATTS